MKLCIIGNQGNFGSFLQKEISAISRYYIQDADTFILSVPFSEYKNAAQQIISIHGNAIHLVNVCSVQEDTTQLLLGMIDNDKGAVTSIHPLFGPRSPILATQRTSIVTYRHGEPSASVVEVFTRISSIAFLSPKQHDQYMAKTHYRVVKIADQINEIVESAKDVPDYMLTPSFKKMRELSNQFMDMPEGTRDSILSNKYGSNV